MNMMTCYCVLLFIAFVAISGHGAEEVPVPLTRVCDSTAVCLDGSPAGYYFSAGSGEGVNNWIVYLMGGGWCYNLENCLSRTNISLGSTYNVTAYNFKGMLSANATVNPEFYNWNRVLLHYCDGASFLGDSEVPNLQFRGSRIFSVIINELLLAKGMNNADNAILAGGSAGGLATILHCDEFRGYLPNAARVKCVADAGFFIRGKDLPRPDLREGPFAGAITLHNLTNFLPTSCTSRFDPKLCLFAEYLIGDVQTPLFLLNSVFDSYQIRFNVLPAPSDRPGWAEVCVFSPNKCTPPQKQLITEFGNALRNAIEEPCNIPSRGMFINACFAHVYSDVDELWNSDASPRMANMTVSEAVATWYFDRGVVQLIDTQTGFPTNCTSSCKN